MKILEKIKEFIKIHDEINREKASELLEWELKELENTFAILVLGAFIGFPSTPIHVTMELLPYMETDLLNMIEKVSTANDPLGELFSILDID